MFNRCLFLLVVLFKKKKKKRKAKQQLQFCTCMSLNRGAALMEGAKPKTDSANTFGEKVSANANCMDGSEPASPGIIHNVLCVALRGNGG